MVKNNANQLCIESETLKSGLIMMLENRILLVIKEIQIYGNHENIDG